MMGATRISRGEVEAVFEAFTTGGFIGLLHGEVTGAPVDVFGSHGAIRPFDAWNGLHFCAEDWHVILVAVRDGGDNTFTRQDAERVLSASAVTFTLDGQRLSTTRTAIKRLLDPARFNLQEAYAFQEGRIMSPDDLSVGEHALSVVVTDPAIPTFQKTIHFTIDPAGTGACVS
jgi:hypothetical protein